MIPTRLFDLLAYQAEKYPQDDAMVGHGTGTRWRSFTTKEIQQLVNGVSKGLISLGVKKGDRIAILSQNRPTWMIVDLAILQLGAVSVPIYPTISRQDYQYIFSHADPRYIFVATEELLSRVDEADPGRKSLEGVFTFDPINGETLWEELIRMGKNVSDKELAEHKEAVDKDDLATVIYTSGTSGDPKGVMLSHWNILSNVQSITQLLPINCEHRVVSFLPLSHIFERTVGYIYLYLGVSVYYIEKLDLVLETVQAVKPHMFTTVPRLLEKIYESIILEGYRLKGIRRKLFFKALDLGLRYQHDQDQGWWYRMRLRFAQRWVFRQWRNLLGGELIGIVTGAAALPVHLWRIFTAAGIEIREGYGQTEASPTIAFNRFEPGGVIPGTVGMPLPGVEVRIAEDGEICVKGPNVMMGYYKNPAETAATIDADGWLHTGDIGKIVKGRFIQITDRVKEVFKTSGGKFVAPTPIEERFRTSPFVEQIMVVGADRKFVSALILPNLHYIRNWALGYPDLSELSDEQLLLSPEVQTLFDEIVSDVNEDFGQIEKVKTYLLMQEDWTVEGGEITPSMKLKRKHLRKKYQTEIEQMYLSAASFQE
ncbi:MAG: long-chain fatty acid--CoA ligase [Bacteroidota bacterium]